MRTGRILGAALVLLTAAALFAGPGPNSQTIPSTGQSLSVLISAPPNGSSVPMPPGTAEVRGNCAIGSVAGQPINVVYAVDVSGSTDLNYMVANSIPLVDANGNHVSGDAGDDVNGDGERGDVLDGEIAGVLAVHASTGHPVNVGVVAFATNASAADVNPAAPNTLPISQFFATPPLVDRNGLGGPDIIEVLRSLDSNHNTPTGGQIGKFTLVSRSTLGNNTRF